MENCLFVANLPQSLNNYELTIALYLVFSRFGKVTIVKASRDSAQRPFGFVEFSCLSCCREAIDENDGIGIIIGGRKVRLEMAKNTSKLYIEFPPDKSVESYSIFTSIFPNLKPLPIPNSNAFIVKLDSSFDNETIINQLRIKHPDWIVQIKSDQNGVQCNLNYHVAETAQRQSGLFQLRIPDSGVLPVAPATLAKIHSFSPCLQYSVSSLQQQQQHPNSSLNFSSIPTPQIMNRLYEDWYEDGHEESFQDVNLAREELDKKLVPSLGEWEGDVFLGRLDNQKVTIKNLLEFTSEFGTVQFLRLCNRSIIREDRIPVDSTAFVRFEESSSAKEFIENVNGSTWLGRIVKCEKCWSWSLSAERRGMTPPISMTVKKENQ